MCDVPLSKIKKNETFAKTYICVLVELLLVDSKGSVARCTNDLSTIGCALFLNVVPAIKLGATVFQLLVCVQYVLSLIRVQKKIKARKVFAFYFKIKVNCRNYIRINHI